MQHGRDDGAAVLQRLHDVLLRGAQGVKVGAAAERPRVQQDLRQRRRVRQALQHAVHEAGVAQILQPGALRSRPANQLTLDDVQLATGCCCCCCSASLCQAAPPPQGACAPGVSIRYS